VLKIKEILEATGGTLVSEGPRQSADMSIDSRTIGEGELFLALKGERFDGHDFVETALRVGAGAVVSRQWFASHSPSTEGKTIIAVEDTLQALHDIARDIRKRFRGPVLAVIGSNGKTTTKELISSILGTKLNVLKTEGNLNNHIGMPLSMTKVSDRTDVMVLEMGTNRPGDVELLCKIASPNIGVVTNIGMEHLEGFGSLEAVRDAELEILPYVKEIVVNGDDVFLAGGVSPGFRGRIITFGIDNRESDVMAREITVTEDGSQFNLHVSGATIPVESKLSGSFNIYNSLAACAAAHTLRFGLDTMKKGLESFGGVKMRFEIKRLGGVTYLYDVYNANPSSMKASIRELVRMAGRTEKTGHVRAVAVLGDMLELGDYSTPAHEEVGKMLSELGIDLFIGVGPLMAKAVSEFGKCGRPGIAKDTAEEAGTELAFLVRQSDAVLIKGSRGMKMEKVMNIIDRGMAGNTKGNSVPVTAEGRR
jgi:UDP-N-acetylmuramoyl-tripeptide--D-alanyl-D-alanine ligase